MDARRVAVPLAQALPGVRLVPGLVRAVDLGAQTVTLGPGHGQPESLAYDRLVFTPGSVTRLPDVPGLAEHARGLKSVAEALYLHDHLLLQLELSLREPDPVQQRGRRTVVVVGASYAGTELVAQLRALADAAARGHGLDPAEVRFLLLDVADRVMPEVGGTLGDRALEVLRGRGIDVRLGTSVQEVTADAVVLSDGSRVEARTVAWVAGVEANPVVATLGVPLQDGRLVVRPDLSVPGHPEVFAGGDAAAVPDLTRPGQVTPPTAQHALRQGHALARNVAAGLGIGRSRPYRHRDLGLVVDLGPRYAVADPLGLHLSGWPAKLVTRGYHLAALPHGPNRLGVALDWLTGLVAPRPAVRLGLVDSRRAGLGTGEHRPDQDQH
jgi:NADH dehydrogenase